MKNILMGVLVILMFLATVLSFSKVGEMVGGWIGVAGGTVTTLARSVLGASVGLYLISTGVAALAVPVLGIALIAVGLVILAYSVWPYFSKSGSGE